ncbi:MAG TPA: sulfur transferase domain-containing protein [Marinagarivorans sp.]
MNITPINSQVSVSEQVYPEHIPALVAEGVGVLVCNRPDGEAAEQPSFAEVAQAAEAEGITCYHIAFAGGEMTDAQVEQFRECINTGKRLHAYCRTGNRSSKIFERASNAESTPAAEPSAPKSATSAGAKADASATKAVQNFDVVIVGAGSGGLATAASLLKRNGQLRIAVIDPATTHYYQPAWTLVGGGAYDIGKTARPMQSVIPDGVTWLNDAVATFEPEGQQVQLAGGDAVHYQHLVVAPGLALHWQGIEGLSESLGQHGVTSNYSFKLAPYTFELVKNLKGGNAVFTQPPMPIKCAGAPQKAMYLAADYWLKHGQLANTQVHFYNAGAVLFGVQAYLPALQSYIERYDIQLHFQRTLCRVDGPNKTAWFSRTEADGSQSVEEAPFDMLHVCPPQRAPDFIRQSPLADEAGWLAVDPNTLQHTAYPNIWGLGDVINAPNAKTLAAVRKQAPVVAHNIVRALQGDSANALYDGYGSCPLTVERGKVVLAEFSYGGKLAPSFPAWLLEGTRPTRLAWYLKADVLPSFYWHGMLKGHEWLASPKVGG